MAKGTLIWDAAFSEQVIVMLLTENNFQSDHICHLPNIAEFPYLQYIIFSSDY